MVYTFKRRLKTVAGMMLGVEAWWTATSVGTVHVLTGWTFHTDWHVWCTFVQICNVYTAHWSPTDKKGKRYCKPLMGKLHDTATECHLSYGITQCYLLPNTSEHTPPHPSQTGWYSIYRPFKGGGLSKPRPMCKEQEQLAHCCYATARGQRDPKHDLTIAIVEHANH